VDGLRDVQRPAGGSRMLGQGAIRDGGQHQRRHLIDGLRPLRGGLAENVGQPDVHVHRQVQALGLHAATGDDRHGAGLGQFVNLEIGQVSVAHGGPPPRAGLGGC